MRMGPLEPWTAVAASQSGVVTRRQLEIAGVTQGRIRGLLRSGRFVPLVHGVYATYTGPVSVMSPAWAAVLWAGAGSAVGGRTALWLWRVQDRPPPVVQVCLPISVRRRTVPPWIDARVRRGMEVMVHPTARPPRLRPEAALLDECDRLPEEQASGLLLAAVQRRVTTAARITAVLETRARHSKRALVRAVVADASSGVHSELERRYLLVERAHGLPRGQRNLVEASGGRVRYRDVEYPAYRCLVELDRVATHRGDELRDRARDRSATLSGRRVLRFGWPEVVGSPCSTAREVARLLGMAGWAGPARRCGPGCPVDVDEPLS